MKEYCRCYAVKIIEVSAQSFGRDLMDPPRIHVRAAGDLMK